MKKLFTLLALTITFSMSAQMDDNSANGTNLAGDYAVAMGYNTAASGYTSTAMGHSTTASGNISTAMGRNTTASGLYSTAMGNATTASGTQSTAMGYETTASDYASLVIGQYNLAGATVTSSATAFNGANTAFVIGNGINSGSKSDAFKVMFNGDTTIGNDLTVSGDVVVSTFNSSGATSLATAGGVVNVAKSGVMTTVKGTLNVDEAVTLDTTLDVASSTIVGGATALNGGLSMDTNKFTVADISGNVATAGTLGVTGASTLSSTLDVTGDTSVSTFDSSGATSLATGGGVVNVAKSGVMTTVIGTLNVDEAVTLDQTLNVAGTLSLGGTAITSTAAELNLLDGVTAIGSGILSSVTESGKTGVRLSTANAANYGNIGTSAVDLSFSSSSSTTKGATGNYSTATGYNSTASGNTSTATGYNTTASNEYTVAMGRGTVASGSYSTAMGAFSQATGTRSTAMGQETEATGAYAFAWGDRADANGTLSTAFGTSTAANGYLSTVTGNTTTASDYASLVIGQHNLAGATVTSSATAFNTANTAFVIGNGANSGSKSDAFKVMFNGDATVSNDLTVSGDVVVSSDARLKANIVSLGSTLSRLLLIDGKTYTMKKDGKQKIGVLAQDIREVFPELVSEDANEMLAVNYQGLVPVLINALKEQDGKMNQQQSEIDVLKEQESKYLEQEKRLERLEKLVAQLD